MAMMSVVSSFLLSAASGPACIFFPVEVQSEGSVESVSQTFIHAYSGAELTINGPVSVSVQPYVGKTASTQSEWILRLTDAADLFRATTPSGELAVAGFDAVHCHDGDDYVLFLDGDPDLEDVHFDGGLGNDVMWANSHGASFFGGGGDDTLLGGPVKDGLLGGDGRDYLWGGEGNNVLHGGGDDDIVVAGAGNDLVTGGAGDDQISVGDGANDVHGGAGDDVIQVGIGDDIVRGGEGGDRVYGGGGGDSIVGDEGDDELYGEGGDDVISGGPGNDLLDGGEGDDRLIDTEGYNSFSGGEGSDLLVAGVSGALPDESVVISTLDGGPGADTYVLPQRTGAFFTLHEGSHGGVDVLRVHGILSEYVEYVRIGDDLHIMHSAVFTWPADLVCIITDQYAGGGRGIEELWIYEWCDDGSDCSEQLPVSIVNLRDIKATIPCPTDFNEDGSTDGGDLASLLAAFETVFPDYDLDGDAWVSASDLAILLAAWGECPTGD